MNDDSTVNADDDRMSPQRPRIAIVFFETYLGCAPSIINAARALDEHGFDVDILIRHDRGRFAEPPFLGPHVCVITVDSEAAGSSPSTHEPSSCDRSSPEPEPGRPWLRRLFSQNQRRRIGGLLESGRQFIHAIKPSTIFAREQFTKHAIRVATGNKYVCLIGVDTVGLVAAHRIAEQLGVGVIYWSLEIMFVSDFKDRIGKRWKLAEKACHQQAIALVIQDDERAAALCTENDADSCPVILVPNSPRQFPRPDVPRDYFHRMFHLPPQCRVVLHAGSVCEGMRSHELAEAAASWPSDMKLVFHSHTHLNRHDEYAQSLVDIGRGNVLLSAAPVSYDDLDELYSSALIGLVIYDRSLGPNFTLLAGASGKLAHCLRCGIPVISIDNESIGRVVEEARCGIAVDAPGDIKTAIETILASDTMYRENALACYRKAYEFDKHFAVVLGLIESQRIVASHHQSQTDGMQP